MEEREAIEFLKERMEVASDYPEIKQYSEALKVSIQALEKQIPKKPRFDFNMSDTLSRYHCVCGKLIKVKHDSGTLDNSDAPNYRNECGQRLDWSEESEE